MTKIFKDSQEIITDLDKAGEGIFTVKVFFAKHLLFPLLNSVLSWDKAWDMYEVEGQKIIALCEHLNEESLFERVLVPKLFGLEDNSRYYSVAMTLEHLLMVGMALQVRILLLSRGKKVQNHVKIEDVKPYKKIDSQVLENFKDFLTNYREKLNKNIENIHIDNTSQHPWFGAFNPKQWSILALVHQIVHRREIEAIVKGLKS
jgi:hypothetical protein